jgi:hypothetical protein
MAGPMMSHSTVVVFGSFFLTAVFSCFVAHAGTIQDPLNDLLASGPNPPDFIGVSGNISGLSLRVDVEFKPGTFQQPPGAGTTGVGIYIDTDLNPATGGSGISGGGVDFANIGWDYLVILQGAFDSGIFEYIGPTNNDAMISGIASSTFTSDGFSTTNPLSTIGADDGHLTLKVASFTYVGEPGGPISSIYDVAPDIGAPALGVFTGDYDDDGRVDDDDLELWQTNYGTTVAVPGTGADGNGDGLINAADYVVWRNRNGSAPPATGTLVTSSSVTTAIPEPSTVGLVALAMLVVGVRFGGPARKTSLKVG